MLKPLKNKVIISVEKNNKTESGLMITSNSEVDSVLGKVVAVSDNCFDIVNINSTVIISKFSGSKIQYEGEEYLVIDIDNILAVVEEG